jgi:subtilisin family serine protease
VVGLVDTGINPYHEVFQDADAQLPAGIVDAVTGAAPIPVRLSREGNGTERFEHDKSVWDGLEPGRLYWFVGTRVLGVSLGRPPSGPILYEDGGHGTGVASMVRNVSRDAWIVMVPAGLYTLAPSVEYVASLGGPSAEAIRWLAKQPWVDAISLSLGYPGNPPVTWNGVMEATRAASLAGKLVISGAGDEPMPNLQTGTSGPPWVVSVGGAEPSARGVSSHASTTVDVISDYSIRMADNGTSGYLNFSGTSFSAPLVAGVVAEALLEARAAAKDASRAGATLCVCDGRNVTEAGLRAALNASGEYWALSEWQPLNYSHTGNKVVDLLWLAEPVGPAPWVQMGWGYVGAKTVPVLAAALLGREPPAKPAEAVQFMSVQQAAREAFWGAQPLPRS